MKDFSGFLKPFGVALLLGGFLGMGCATPGDKTKTLPSPSVEAPLPVPKAPEPTLPEVKPPEPPPPPPSPVPFPPAEIRESVPPPPVPTEPAEKVTYFTHTVRFSGESISIIAAWYTGDLENWKILAPVNTKIDPNRIFIGNKVLIPENLLKTREPMPREFMESFYEKGKLRKKPIKSAPPATKEKEEETELFGPKSAPKK